MAKKSTKITKLDRPELIKLVAIKAGITQKDTAAVFSAMSEVFRDCALNGKKFSIPGFGKLNFSTVAGRKERYGIVNPVTQEKGELPATLPYTKPVFKFSLGLKNELKDVTKDRPMIELDTE